MNFLLTPAHIQSVLLWKMGRVCLVYSLQETAKKNKCRLLYYDQIKGNCSSEQRDSLCSPDNKKELLQSCLLSPLTGCWMCSSCYSFIIYLQNPTSNLPHRFQSKTETTEINISHCKKSLPQKGFTKGDMFPNSEAQTLWSTWRKQLPLL